VGGVALATRLRIGHAPFRESLRRRKNDDCKLKIEKCKLRIDGDQDRKFSISNLQFSIFDRVSQTPSIEEKANPGFAMPPAVARES
jgi:hypothetical protein